MKKKQTAVQWLEYMYINGENYSVEAVMEWFKQAKQIEKEQIVNAWDDGDYCYFYSKETGNNFENGEEYYNENYE